MGDERPNPDQLLADVGKQGATARSGRLKRFSGMAAGEGRETALPPARSHSRRDWRGFAWAVAVVAAATALGWPLYHKLNLSNTNVLMLYLLGVLWVATHHSRGAAILASVLGVMAFDFTFVEPYYTLSVHDQQYVVTFMVMLLTALVISALTLRVRAQAEAARQRERRTAALLALSRELAALRTSEDIAAAIVRHVSEMFGGRAAMLLPDGDKRLVVKANGAEPMAMDAKEIGVAQWAYDHEQTAGAGTATLPAASGTYVPLKASRGAVGIVGVFSESSAEGWGSEQRQLVEAFASLGAMALERAALVEEARAAWERVEAEFLRNTLLSGVSHELRTPLAAITGAVSSLTETGERLPSEARRDMLDTIHSEAERMERLITNLLDMTRLESGGLALKKEWQPLAEVIGSALHHLDRRLHGRAVRTDVPADLPLVRIDGIAIEQVLVNLIDNAVEYTPADTPIEVAVRTAHGEIAVEVADRGPGLPAGAERRVFDKFFRAHPAETRRGIGLGLAIARGIVEAHGGRIAAMNRAGGGAVFQFTLPLYPGPPLIDSTA